MTRTIKCAKLCTQPKTHDLLHADLVKLLWLCAGHVLPPVRTKSVVEARVVRTAALWFCSWLWDQCGTRLLRSFSAVRWRCAEISCLFAFHVYIPNQLLSCPFPAFISYSHVWKRRPSVTVLTLKMSAATSWLILRRVALWQKTAIIALTT